MTTNCPLCGAGGTGRTVTNETSRWRVCAACGAWILEASTAAEQYPADYYGSGPAKFGGPAGMLRTRYHGGRAKRLRGMCGTGTKNLYDIGCGDGAFLVAARELGFDVRGCEPESVPRQQASARLGLGVDQDMFGGPTPTMWDVVTAWQVIEHVPDPRAFVRAIRKSLKQDGIFAVSTVNIDSWQAKVFGSDWLHLDPPRHLWCGGLQSLERLLQEEGFSIKARRWNWTEFGPVGFVDSSLNKLGFERDLLVHKLKTAFNGPLDGVFWAAAALTPFAVVLAACEAAAGRPSTFEIYASPA